MNTVLVTGANRGLGLGLVEEFLQEGWRVFAACRHPDQAKALHELAQKNPGLRLLKLNVKDEAHIQELADQLKGEAIDVLINNAGVMIDPHDGQFRTHIGEVEKEHLLESFEVNTIAPLLLTQALLPALKNSKKPIVVNMSSTLGSIARNNEGGIYGYRASKAALNAITKNLAIELKNKVTVVSFHPGWVRTDMGGRAADLALEESVKPMKQLILKLTLNDSGKFFSYTGEELEW